MPRAAKKFRFPHAASIPVNNPALIKAAGKHGTGVYLRSISKELVTILKDLCCKNCDINFNKKNLPRIGKCGHYVCEKCIYVDPEKTTYFECSDCEPNGLPANVWIKDPVFEDFYKDIEKEGFRCETCEKDQNLHPRHNVVRIIHDGKRDMSKHVDFRRYLCVWCALKSGDTFEYRIRFATEVVDESDTREGDKLNSLDRTTNYATYGILECCSCMKPLIADKDGKNAPAEVIHTPCGHIIEKGCNYENKVYCNLCIDHSTGNGHPWTKESLEMQPTVSHIQEYTKNIVYERRACYKCEMFHPRSNIDETRLGMCVWCTVEEKMKCQEKQEEMKRRVLEFM